ncbi:glycoside hydrolase family 3 C-terminal domain-containing protein [Carboxylicivirga caseinilyticus]|uniref:glycoside hydrolase family 3 C-terminal domain-containing protein n=1 Tax=Carboxylicivirga caseinilyticus TaxID=3417572 RepID=UPI003D356DE6|nr:glycoside hydrolase family 3 C-terminal domain-containing protein [Marinilabiliaceae bacterium A049]
MKKTFLMVMLVLVTQIISAQQSQQDVEKKIDDIIKQLTLKEKVDMCHAQSKFSSPGVPRLGIPEIWMSDGPHGVRGEINWDNWGYAGWTNDSITAFPALTCLASTFNPDLAHQYGVAVGEEARYRRKDILLGPGVNIYRTPLNGRNFEYMGEDPYLASIMVVPYVQGVQENGVAACVKHYALNNQEEWRGHINVNVDDRTLHEIYLPAFKAAVTKGHVWSVMGAYNKYNGQHASHHEILVNKILKGDWGFDGVLVTDWGSAHDTKEAAYNGLDIEMGTWTNGLTFSANFAYDNYFLANPFYEMLKSGEIEESVVDDKVRRILRLMFRTNMNMERGLGRINNKEHHEVARKVATEGIVLMKNENNFFPINPEKEMTIAVIGENATKMMTIGGGSSELKAQYEISPLEGIKLRFTKATILHSMGYSSGPSAYGRVIPPHINQDSLYAAAIETAKKADIVLFVGGLNKNHHQDCEGGDRLTFELPFNQNALLKDIIAVNPNVGMVMVSGNAVAMPWLKDVKAMIQTWYLGSDAGYAIADVLSGDVNPSGKLPFSFPAKLNDNPAHYYGELSYPGDSIDQYYKEGILVGYRWHDTKKIKPLFAFGHGLSYSNFELNNIKTDKSTYSAGQTMKVSCDVANVGSLDGAEVVQVYVGKVKSKVDRAIKELKGFDKVQVVANDKQTVNISIDIDDLAYYCTEKGGWELEKGQYIVYVGTASDQIKKKIKISVE